MWLYLDTCNIKVPLNLEPCLLSSCFSLALEPTTPSVNAISLANTDKDAHIFRSHFGHAENCTLQYAPNLQSNYSATHMDGHDHRAKAHWLVEQPSCAPNWAWNSMHTQPRAEVQDKLNVKSWCVLLPCRCWTQPTGAAAMLWGERPHTPWIEPLRFAPWTNMVINASPFIWTASESLYMKAHACQWFT